MKAIVKATGEYIEVCRIQAVAGNNLYKDVNSGITYHPEELESIELIRIKATIAAMQGMLASKETMVSITTQAKKHNISVPTALAMLSVDDANGLMEELQKRGGQDGTSKV